MTKLYCGKCDKECDYMGINPDKILAFVCHACNEFNEVADAKEDDRPWVYATNSFATITADVVNGKISRIAPIAYKFTGQTVEEFAKNWKANRLFLYTSKVGVR